MAPNDTLRARQRQRARPTKTALTRQGIIHAALTILRAEGLSKLTLRRIAAALETGPASLYVYFRDTEDLHVQLLDALLEPVNTAILPDGPWQDRLNTLLIRYRDVLFTYPEIARMALSTRLSGPQYLTLVDAALALLQEGGLTDHQAAWGIDLLLLFATSVAAEQSTRQSKPGAAEQESTLAFEVAAADPRQYPQIARLGQALLSGTGPERFKWGLNVLLAGMQCPEDAAPSAAAAP
ncbi:TetR/AcrR family transcriptional regulator [Deinococcus ruber]|uniref:TetR family transcriptional regulator n=1 Tax=Deinococcus ruber TaxID=1848197 RepID=A0A918FBP1_9DEIO|nr:TetR/AcrR family transcriptional regulator [Deinococcus ruber]GGR28357.1 TetR family transcriptional regulator [Deinococcus ruber]